MKQSEDTRIYRDGGYGWVVVLAVFFMNGIGDGIGYTFGILLVDLIDTFQSNRGPTALAGGLYMCLYVASGLVAGPLSDIYGYRTVSVAGAIIGTVGLLASGFVTELYQLYITFGVLGGTGYGLADTPALICVIHNFRKRRSLANGIALCGSGAGMFGLSALVGYIQDIYGWRGTFIVLAGVNIHSVVCALLLNSLGSVKKERYSSDDITDSKVNVEQKIEIINSKEKTDGQAETVKVTKDQDVAVIVAIHEDKVKSNRHQAFFAVKGMFQDIEFVTFLLTVALSSFGFLMPIHLLPDQAIDLGIQNVFWIVSILGIGNSIGRLIFGVLGDVKCLNRFILFVTTILLAGVATASSCLDTTFEFKMGYACVYGLMIGGYISLGGVVLADITGADNIGKGYGLYLGAMTFGFALGGPLGGMIYDMTGNYNYSFIFAGSFFIIGAVICCIPRVYNLLTIC